MKPFKPNEQQLEAIANGCTKLWVPIDSATHSLNIRPSMFQSAKKFPCDNCSGTGFNGLACEDCYGKGYSYDIDCESTTEFIKKYSPLKSNEEYFVQEEFYQNESIFYKKDGWEQSLPYEDADQMSEEQSRFKFKVTGVEVKSCQELSMIEIRNLGLLSQSSHLIDCMNLGGAEIEFKKDHISWHDSQYPEQPYSSNPSGFLVAIERVD